MDYRYTPFGGNAFQFLKYCIIKCRRAKKKDRKRDISLQKGYYCGMCFLTHKSFSREECDEIFESYWQELLNNPEHVSKIFDEYDKCYKVKDDSDSTSPTAS